MKTSFLWMSSIWLVLCFCGCKDHECPNPLHTVVLQGEDIYDVNCTSYYPNLNRGSDGRLQTAAWTYSGDFGATRTFLNFNLSSIPPQATILSAELTLYSDTTNFISTAPAITGHSALSGSNSWKVKRITSDWSESTVTWATKPTYDDIGAISMPASTANDQTYVVNITPLLNDQLKNPSSYFGVMLQLDIEVQYRVIAFCSTEHPYASQLKPTLKITYKK